MLLVRATCAQRVPGEDARCPLQGPCSLGFSALGLPLPQLPIPLSPPFRSQWMEVCPLKSSSIPTHGLTPEAGALMWPAAPLRAGPSPGVARVDALLP